MDEYRREYNAEAQQAAIDQRVAEIIQVSQTVLSDKLLLEEFERQIRTWGATDHDPQVWVSFMTEEMGEIAHAINTKNSVHAVEEITQLMALGIQLIRQLAANTNDIETFLDSAAEYYSHEPEDYPL